MIWGRGNGMKEHRWRPDWLYLPGVAGEHKDEVDPKDLFRGGDFWN